MPLIFYLIFYKKYLILLLRFHEAISKAMEACSSSGYATSDQFAKVGKMVSIGSGAERESEDEG